MTDSRITPLIIAGSTIDGITAIIYISISIIIGLLLIIKFLKYKDKKLLFIGLNFILLPSSWWPAAFGYLLALGGIYLENIPYSIILQIPQTVNIFLWIYIFSEMQYPDKQKKIKEICAIYATSWAIIYLSFVFINVDLLVIIRQGIIDISYRLPALIMVAMHLSIFVVTFTIFGREALKSSDQETRLKGKFLFLFLGGFIFGTLFDSFIPGDFGALPARIVLILASICLYLVFAMPEGLKKRLLKQ